MTPSVPSCGGAMGAAIRRAAGPLEHYINQLRSKPYVYADHLLPHDVQVRELSSGRSRQEMLKSLGLTVVVVRAAPVEDGISAVRSIMNQLLVRRRQMRAGAEGSSRLSHGVRQQGSDLRQRPLHDWTSHAGASGSAPPCRCRVAFASRRM